MKRSACVLACLAISAVLSGCAIESGTPAASLPPEKTRAPASVSPVDTGASITAVFQTRSPVSKNDLSYCKESGGLAFHCSPQDKSGVGFVNAPPPGLPESAAVIREHLRIPTETNIDVYLWPTVDDFHVAMGMPDAPAWVRGTIGYNAIYTVSPLALGGLSLERVLLHEYTHVLEMSLASGPAPRWLAEGLASYEGREMAEVTIKSRVAGSLPTLDELNDPSRDFEAMGGYPFSYTAVEYIIETFGYDSLIRFYQNPDDFEGVFQMDKAGFEAEWKKFVDRKYKGN